MSCAKDLFEPKEATSVESLAWIQSHIDKCLKGHSKCSKEVDTPFPRRILCLATTESGSIDVTLQETGGALGRYTCLSHSWGGSDACNTTRASYAEYIQGIAWSSIPMTFQDAIKLSMAMGIHHIWIDSLCIVQDDPVDWTEQASEMASIYQNSYITLAATTSANHESGCLWEADSLHVRQFKTKKGCFSVQKATKHWKQSWTSNSASFFPLLSRAWVFQERLLAPRVLHLSHNELVWECMETGSCQCNGYDEWMNQKRVTGPVPSLGGKPLSCTRRWILRGSRTAWPPSLGLPTSTRE